MRAPQWAELGPDESSESDRQTRQTQIADWKWVDCDLTSPSVDPELDLVALGKAIQVCRRSDVDLVKIAKAEGILESESERRVTVANREAEP